MDGLEGRDVGRLGSQGLELEAGAGPGVAAGGAVREKRMVRRNCLAVSRTNTNTRTRTSDACCGC